MGEMTELQDTILQYMNVHRKVSVAAILRQFPGQDTWDVMAWLVKEGYCEEIKHAVKMADAIIKVDALQRTSKQKWEQQSLFPEE